MLLHSVPVCFCLWMQIIVQRTKCWRLSVGGFEKKCFSSAILFPIDAHYLKDAHSHFGGGCVKPVTSSVAVKTNVTG